MTYKKFNEIDRDWSTSPPGATISDLLEELVWDLGSLAFACGISETDAALLLVGRLPITDELAEKLANILGPTKEFWLRREELYRNAVAHSQG